MNDESTYLLGCALQGLLAYLGTCAEAETVAEEAARFAHAAQGRLMEQDQTQTRVLLDEEADDLAWFGCEPGDSAALLHLRGCIDDQGGWPDEATEEAGDYEAWVRNATAERYRLEAKVTELTLELAARVVPLNLADPQPLREVLRRLTDADLLLKEHEVSLHGFDGVRRVMKEASDIVARLLEASGKEAKESGTDISSQPRYLPQRHATWLPDGAPTASEQELKEWRKLAQDICTTPTGTDLFDPTPARCRETVQLLQSDRDRLQREHEHDRHEHAAAVIKWQQAAVRVCLLAELRSPLVVTPEHLLAARNNLAQLVATRAKEPAVMLELAVRRAIETCERNADDIAGHTPFPGSGDQIENWSQLGRELQKTLDDLESKQKQGS